MLAIAASTGLQCNAVSSANWGQIDQFPNSCFMQRSAWLKSAWDNYHSTRSGVYSDSFTALQVGHSDGETLGVSAWFKQFSLGINWWRMVGSGQVCSDYVQLPSAPGSECEVAQATAKWFAVQPRKFLDLPTAIEVEGYCSDSPQWQTFFETLVDRGWTHDSVAIDSAWRIDLPESWSEYESLLSKSRRRKTRRAAQLLDRGELGFDLVHDTAEIAELWPEFVRLHQVRRQQLGQAGVFVDLNFERFLQSAMLDLAKDHSAFFAKLTHQNSVLGLLLIFQTDSTWFIYQSGFDTQRIDLEPGHMINSLMLRTAIEQGIKKVDFLRGDEPYKKGWHSTPATLHRSILLPPSLASRGISSAIKVKRNVQFWL